MIKATSHGQNLPAIDFKLPVPEVVESAENWLWLEWDHACEDMDDVSEWAVTHPLINPRMEA